MPQSVSIYMSVSQRPIMSTFSESVAAISVSHSLTVGKESSETNDNKK